MPDPPGELPDDAQRLAAAEGPRRVPRELLVGHVRVVLELTGGLDDVDAPAALAAGQLGAPDRGVEGRREVDVVHHPARFEVRFAPGNQQIASRQLRLRAVQVHARLVHLERYGLARGAHAAMLAAAWIRPA